MAARRAPRLTRTPAAAGSSAMTSRSCAHCHTPLDPGAVFFQVQTTIRGEQDIAELAAAENQESPHSLLERLSTEGDWQRYADEVHWEFRATLCPTCRRKLVASLSEFGRDNADPRKTD